MPPQQTVQVENRQILKHDAENELFLYTLTQPTAFRSQVTTGTVLRMTKTNVTISNTLKVNDVQTNELVVRRMPDGYTLYARFGTALYALIEGSKMDPDELVKQAVYFLCPDDADPRVLVVKPPAPKKERAPRAKAAASTSDQEDEGYGAASQGATLRGLDGPEDDNEDDGPI